MASPSTASHHAVSSPASLESKSGPAAKSGDGGHAGGVAPAPEELRRILHLSVPIIVKLAERDMPVASVLKFNTGSILEFDRPADAEMELLVNNRTIGRGFPVKVGENFGLRLSSVGDLESTIQALGHR